MKNGKVILSFGEKPEWAVPTESKNTDMLRIMMEKWIQVREELKEGTITDNDYFMWESRYPENNLRTSSKQGRRRRE